MPGALGAADGATGADDSAGAEVPIAADAPAGAADSAGAGDSAGVDVPTAAGGGERPAGRSQTAAYQRPRRLDLRLAKPAAERVASMMSFEWT